MKTDITKFIKEGKSLYDLICLYTSEYVNAEEAYALYDLRLRKDFYLFTKMHGFREAINYRRQNRYWWDGFNYTPEAHQGFEGPQPESEEGMRNFINEYVLDAILDDKEKGWDIGYWGDVLDLEAMHDLITFTETFGFTPDKA